MENNAITYGNIKLISPYEIKELKELKIVKEINDHSKVYFTGIIPEEKKDEYINIATSKDKIEINLLENGSIVRALFKGIVSNIKVKAVNNIYYLEVEVMSCTYDLDVKIKKRSFQNKNMSYSELIEKVISSYAGADYMNLAAEGKKLERFMLQYNETDWQFLKRAASYNGHVIVADDASDKPRFWFGIPKGKDGANLEDFHYVIKRNLYSCMDTTENYCESLEENDFTFYEVESITVLNLGDKVSLKGKALIVSKITAVMEDGILNYRYILNAEKGIRQNTIKNESMIGASIEGKVIDVSKDTIKIHLEIDENQGSGEACWFSYSSLYTSEGGTGWYCMPQVGDHVKLYIPSSNENDAAAISSVRKGGGSCAKTADPSTKYIGTSSGKEIMLGGSNINLTAKEGAVFIKLDEGDGIQIQSNNSISVTSGGDLVMDTGSKMTIKAKDAVYFMCKQSSIVMDGKTDLKGSKVKMEGTIKSPVVVEEDPEDIADAEAEAKAAGEAAAAEESAAAEEANQEKEDNKGLLLDGLQLGLDVLGMIPGPVGIVANVVNAGISFARGDKAGAAMALVCCIPFAGAALKGSKLAKGAGKAAKIAGKLGKLAKAGKTASKVTKIAKKASKAVKIKNLVKYAPKAKKVVQKVGTVVTKAIELKDKVDTIKNIKGSIAQIKNDIVSVIQDPRNPRNWINIGHDAMGIIPSFGNRKHKGGKPDKKNHKPEKNKKQTDIVKDAPNSRPNKGERTSQKNENDIEKGKYRTQASDKQVCDKDPINVVTGSFYLKATDLVMEDRGLDIDIVRSYNSTDTSIGPMGRGWTFYYESCIKVKSKDEVILLYPDGHLETFKKVDDIWKNESTKSKANILLDDNKTGGFILKLKDKITHNYDKYGKLISISDRNNNKITIDYDEDGNIKTITSSGGKELYFKYNYGKIVEIADNIGRKAKYEYEDNNIINVFHTNGGVLTYTYENNLITAVTDQDGYTYVKNEYDRFERVIKQIDRDGNLINIEYNDKDMETTFINRTTKVVEKYKYNRKKLVTEKIFNDGTKETYTYDEFDNKNSERDRSGKIISRIYDERGNLLEEIYPGDYKIKNYYDSDDNLIKRETSGGEENLYSYDNRGNLLEKLVKIQGESYAKTTFTYDEYGRTLEDKDPEGNVAKFKYAENHLDKATSVEDPEGNIFKYKYDEAGRMMSITTDYGTVEFGYNALNKKTHIIDAKGNITRLMYDKMGNLVKRVLPNEYNSSIDNGNGYEYRYDPMDRLVRTTDPLQNVFAVKYDSEGNLIKEINPNYYDRVIDNGLGVEYEYDNFNQRIKVIYPTGGIQRIKYDTAGNIIKIIEPTNYNKDIDDGKGTEYFYDEGNRLVTIKDQEGNIARRFIYDENDNVVKEIDAKGYLSGNSDETRYGTLYKYNTAGWMLEKRVPVEEESEIVRYNVTLYSYDKAGRRIKEKISPEYVDENKYPKEWNTIAYTYDKNSRIIKITDTTGSEIQYAYDCLGNKTLERARINANTYKVKRYSYNSVGWLEKVTEEINEGDLAEETKGKTSAKTLYEYDGNGNITKVITPEGYENIVKYDAAYRLVEIVKRDPEDEESERSTTYEYDSAGNIIKETDCNGYYIIYEYDAMNRQTKIIDKEGNVTRLFYDESGNIIKHITPENYNVEDDDGKGTSYNYDSMNRLVEVTNALGVIVQKNKYNEVGELIEKLDASKTGVEYSYDIGGRVRNIITPGAKEKGLVSQEYKYDALGNVTGIKDGEGNETSYSLDLWGKVKEVQKADGSKEWYDYDYAGNVTATIDGNGNKTEYTYNSLNLLAQIKDPAGEVMTYQYDRQGRLARHTDRNKNIIEYLYNQDDNIVSRKDAVTGTAEEYRYNRDGSLAAGVSGGKVYNYTYTPNMNLKTKAVNGKTVLEYDYNKDGNITALKDITGRKVNYKYDIIGMLKEVWDRNQQAAAYTYNPDSTIAAIKYGNGINVQYNHDADKNISEILAKTKEGKELLNHRYFYDNNGNQVRKDECGNVTSYAYDALNRLNKVVYPNQITEAFGYDKVGNRIKRTLDSSLGSQLTAYTYDIRNRLTELIGDKNLTNFKYDAQGNLASETNKNGTTKYTYDCFNRTASVQKHDGSYIKNFYDPEGFRSEINENGIVSKFVFDGVSVVTELDAEDKLKSASIRGIELISQRDDKDNSYYYLNNYHGDVFNLTDITGNIVNSYSYDAFGNTLESSEQVHNRFRYAGEQYDPITNQYYLRARFYNPVVGRFTQEDEYRGDGLNLYAYVANNPVNYIDPSGYKKQCELKAELIERQQKRKNGELNESNFRDKTKPNANERNATREQYYEQKHNERLDKKLGKLRSDPQTYYTHGELVKLRKQLGISGNAINSHHILEKQFAKKFGINNKDDIIAAGLTPLWHTGNGQVKELDIGLNIDNVINNELSRIVGKPYVVAKNAATAEQIWMAHRNIYEKIGRSEWAEAIYNAYVKRLNIKY